MAKKQAIATETAAAATPARAAKPKNSTLDSTKPRVRSVQHSKTVAPELHADQTTLPQPEAVSVDAPVDHHAAISRIAYGYWESRGYQDGSHVDDWLRAEHEYQLRLAGC